MLQVRRESGAQEGKWLALEMQRYWQGNYACRRKGSAADEEDGSGCLGKWCRTGSKSKGKSVAEAAMERDAVIRAVASAVLHVRRESGAGKGKWLALLMQRHWRGNYTAGESAVLQMRWSSRAGCGGWLSRADAQAALW